jgi:hypothetical protein
MIVNVQMPINFQRPNSIQINWNSLKNVKHISSQLLDNEFYSVEIIAEYAERQKISHSDSVQNATLSILKHGVHSYVSPKAVMKILTH